MADFDLSIVILSWNTKDLTLACLGALQKDESSRSREIIVVDNGSEDGSADAVAENYPDVVLVRNPDNRLYAEGNNIGAKAAHGEYLCLLNSDTEVKPGALDLLYDWLEDHPDYGAASPKLVNFDDTVQRACNRFPGLVDPLVDSTLVGKTPPGSWWSKRTRMNDFDHLTSRDVDQPPGAVMMMKLDEYLGMGGLDETLSLFFNDVDICKRLWKAGRKIRYVAEAEVYHHRGASVGGYLNRNNNSIWFKNRASYYKKEYGAVGEKWVKSVLLLWAGQVYAGIKLGPKNKSEKTQAITDLKAHLKKCLG